MRTWLVRATVTLCAVVCVSGLRHYCVIKQPDQTLHCWGSNAFGQCGTGALARKHEGAATAIAFGAASLTVVDFAVSSTSSCALLSDSTVRCWGANDQGQLGYGLSTSTLGVAADELALLGSQITAGVNCLDSVTLTSGVNKGNTVVVLKCPVNLALAFGGDVPVRLAGGGGTFCILTSAGNARCWGSGQNGVSGYGDTTDRTSPGPRLDFLGGLVARIAISDTVACAVTVENSLLCWGSNEEGGLGLGIIAASNTSAIFTPESDPNGCWDTSTIGGRLLCPTVHPVQLPGALKDVAVGGGSMCFVTTDGLSFCLGDCDDGQCGYRHDDTDGFAGDNGCWKLTGSGSNLFCPAAVPIDVDGTASLFESGGTPTNTVESVSTFADHTCVLLTGGSVKCFGDNLRGELGYGVRPPVLGGPANGYNYPYIAACTIGVDCPVDPCKLSTGDLMCPGPTSVDLAEPVACFLNQAYESGTSESDGVCVVTTAGNVFCHGVNSVGETGIVGGGSYQLVPVQVDLGAGNTAQCGSGFVVDDGECDDNNVHPLALTLLPFIRTDTSDDGTRRPRLQSGNLVLEVAVPALVAGREVSSLEFTGATVPSGCTWTPSAAGPWTSVTDVELDGDATCYADVFESTGLSMSSLEDCGFIKETTDSSGDRLRLDVNGDGVVGDTEFATRYTGVMRISIVDTLAASVLSPPSAPRASNAQRSTIVTSFVSVVLPDDPTFTVDLSVHTTIQLYAMLTGQSYTTPDPGTAGTLSLTVTVDSPAPVYVDPSPGLVYQSGSSTIPAAADMAVAVSSPSFPSADCQDDVTGANSTCLQPFVVDVTFSSQAAFESFCAATPDGVLHAVLAFSYTLTCRSPPGGGSGCPFDSTDTVGSHFTPADDSVTSADGTLSVTVESDDVCNTLSTAVTATAAAGATLTAYSQAVYTPAHEKSAFFEGQAVFFRVAVTSSDLPVESIALLSAEVQDAGGSTHVLIDAAAVTAVGSQLGVVFDPTTDDTGLVSVFRIPSLPLDTPAGSPVFSVPAGEFTQVTVAATVSVEYADGERRRVRVLRQAGATVASVSMGLSVFKHPVLTNPSGVSAQHDAVWNVARLQRQRKQAAESAVAAPWYWLVAPASAVVVVVLGVGLRVRYRSLSRLG